MIYCIVHDYNVLNFASFLLYVIQVFVDICWN